MLEKIKQILDNHQEIKSWSISHQKTDGTQQYDIGKTREAIRQVSTECYKVDVLCDSLDGEGKSSCGVGTVTLLPGDEIQEMIEQAVLTAKLVHNQPFDFPDPGELPKVELADSVYLKDPKGALDNTISTIMEISSLIPGVRISAAECFGQERQTHLLSSKGIDANQNDTEIYIQWVVIAGKGEDEVESFAEIYSRRLADLNLDEEVKRRAQYTADLLKTETAPSRTGPVIVRGGTLAGMLAGEVYFGSMIQLLSSAENKYTGETPWKIGKSIFREEVKGDPLHVFANRQLPYGMNSSVFDSEGIPAQRVSLIQDNQLKTFIASQRFAHYLNLPVTGDFGNLEMSAGSTPTADLVADSHIEIADFSWFNPNPITGDFASEIRLGYLVENGERKPFRGGLLIGNLLDALADVTWSSEIGFYSNYLGPSAARFNNLQVAGE